MFKQLWQHISKRRRKQFFLLLVLMVLATILEVVSIGTVVPFLGVLTSPEQIYHHNLAQPLIQTLGLTSPRQLLLPITIIFIMLVLISAIVRLLLLHALTRLSHATGSDLSVEVYRRTLYQDYSIHTSRNSSEIISSITVKVNTVMSGVVLPMLNLINAVIIMTGVIAIVFVINAQVALITLSIFSLFYWIIVFFNKKTLKKNSQLIADRTTLRVKYLQEGLGGIRDVLIDGTQEFYCKLFKDSDILLRKATGDNIFIGSSPRYIMEAIGMTLLIILAYNLTLQGGGVATAIPILGALVVSAQKLLPTLQFAYISYSSIKGSKSSFIHVINLLNQPLTDDTNRSLINIMPFKQEISFKDLSFRYAKDTPWILKNVNLSFKRGEKVGFIGLTGSGKSTLLDILMGLLTPTTGELLIDGVAITQKNKRAWQMHISHVPQSIFLADGTIQENIAFGVESAQIKEYKVVQVAQHAQIVKFINSLKNKYKSFIGERGIQLSGGQRQRIGIARALYKDTDVLIFDEATSALDNQTEKKIMQQIDKLKGNQTVFMIAHRLTTLEKCDSIIRINTDHTIEKLNYSQI